MEVSRDNEQSESVEIVIDGDVILIVGAEKMKLRVYSLFLKAVSKPFSAMLGPDWKEGQDMLGRDGPVELPLPEGNAAALKIICAIVHHRSEIVPRNLTAGEIFRIAVTADEYDCFDALEFASGHWLQPGENTAADLLLLTAAAYLFNNASAFKEITKALILNHNGSYLALPREELESAITWRVFCKYLNNQCRHLKYIADWLIVRSARGTKKPCKAKAGRNTIDRNNGWG